MIYWRQNDPGCVRWKRIICLALGHYDHGGHPHAAFCGRCGSMGYRLNANATVNTGYPHAERSYIRGRAADGLCTHTAGQHGPAGCIDLYAFSHGLIKGDDGVYRSPSDHLRWLGVS